MRFLAGFVVGLIAYYAGGPMRTPVPRALKVAIAPLRERLTVAPGTPADSDKPDFEALIQIPGNRRTRFLNLSDPIAIRGTTSMHTEVSASMYTEVPDPQ